MSAVGKAAKGGLFLLSALVVLVVAGGVYIYMNMGQLAKQMSEKIASDSLGVSVTIGDMDISLEERKVVVRDIRIANPSGWKKPEAMRIDSITVAAESFSKELLTFALVDVRGTIVNLEVGANGTNLTDLRDNAMRTLSIRQAHQGNDIKSQQIKVILKTLDIAETQVNPSVVLVDKDLAFVMVPEIRLQGIGVKEGGVLAQDAIAQVMNQILPRIAQAANKAGFMEGLSLDQLNQIGVDKIDVFQQKVQENFHEDVDQFKKGIKSLFGDE